MKHSKHHTSRPQWSRIAEQARHAEAPEIDVRIRIMNRIRSEQVVAVVADRHSWLKCLAQSLQSPLTTPTVAALALGAGAIGFAGYRSIDLLQLTYSLTF